MQKFKDSIVKQLNALQDNIYSVFEATKIFNGLKTLLFRIKFIDLKTVAGSEVALLQEFADLPEIHKQIADDLRKNAGRDFAKEEEEYKTAIEKIDSLTQLVGKVTDGLLLENLNAYHNDTAIKYHQKALDIMLKAYESSPNHPDIAKSYNNLGLAYRNK